MHFVSVYFFIVTFFDYSLGQKKEAVFPFFWENIYFTPFEQLKLLEVVVKVFRRKDQSRFFHSMSTRFFWKITCKLWFTSYENGKTKSNITQGFQVPPQELKWGLLLFLLDFINLLLKSKSKISNVPVQFGQTKSFYHTVVAKKRKTTLLLILLTKSFYVFWPPL